MSDIKLSLNEDTLEFDISIHGDVDTGDELTSAVIISSFTWGRPKPDDNIPKDSPIYGYWADKIDTSDPHELGSRLYLLAREKITPETLRKAEDYEKEALQWMIDDKVVTSIDVSVERNSDNPKRVDMLVTLTRDQGQETSLRFSDLWRIISGGKNDGQ